MQWLKIFTECRKAAVGAVAALSAALAAGLIPGQWTPYVTAVIALAATYGLTYAVPNVPPAPEVEQFDV